MDAVYQVGLFETLNILRALDRASNNAKKAKTDVVILKDKHFFATVRKDGQVKFN